MASTTWAVVWLSGLTKTLEALLSQQGIDRRQLFGIKKSGAITNSAIPDVVVVQQSLAIEDLAFPADHSRMFELIDFLGEALPPLRGHCLRNLTCMLWLDVHPQVSGDAAYAGYWRRYDRLVGNDARTIIRPVK